MGDLRECTLCGIEHDDIEGGQFCKECSKKLEDVLIKVLKLPVKTAQNLTWLLSSLAYKMSWAEGEIVSHENQIDRLTLDFERHIHSQGKVFTPYQRRVIIPRRP